MARATIHELKKKRELFIFEYWRGQRVQIFVFSCFCLFPFVFPKTNNNKNYSFRRADSEKCTVHIFWIWYVLRNVLATNYLILD